MIGEALRTHLLDLEQEMHRLDTRQNGLRMEQLLHKDFREFGRSGRSYTRGEILAELTSESEFPEIGILDVSWDTISEDAVLLTYTSFHIHKTEDSEHHSRFTLRASLWVRQEESWRLRFHQGTPKVEPEQPSCTA